MQTVLLDKVKYDCLEYLTLIELVPFPPLFFYEVKSYVDQNRKTSKTKTASRKHLRVPL